MVSRAQESVGVTRCAWCSEVDGHTVWCPMVGLEVTALRTAARQLEALAVRRLADIDALAADRDAWAETARALFWLSAWRCLWLDGGRRGVGERASERHRIVEHLAAAYDRAGSR